MAALDQSRIVFCVRRSTLPIVTLPACVAAMLQPTRMKGTTVAQAPNDLGVTAVLAKRMVEERLPKALALKERVDRGETLNELDLNFLEQVVKDANQVIPLMKHDERVVKAGTQMLLLYKEITAKALENEQVKRG